MAEDKKSVVARLWEEVYEGGDLDALDELLSPGYKLHDLANGKEYDTEGLKSLLSGIREGMPGAAVHIEDQITAEEGKVITHFAVHVRLREGVATGEEPERGGEELELNGMSISRVCGGRIEESWVLWESLLAEQKINPVNPSDDNRWRWPPWRW